MKFRLTRISKQLLPDVSDGGSLLEQKRILLVRAFSVFWVWFTISYSIVSAFLHFLPSQLAIHICFLGLLSSPLLMIRLHWYKAAKLTLIGVLFFSCFLLAFVGGELTHSHWAVILIPATLYVLFDRPNHYVLIGSGLVGFIIIKAIYLFFEPWKPEFASPAFEYFFGFALCFFTYFQIHIYKTETDKNKTLIEMKNRELLENQQVIDSKNSSLEEANKELNRKTKALISLNQELKQFVSVASHDMKEPLRTICSFSALLSKRIPNDPQTSDFLGFIENAAKRMNRLLEDLIKYARVGVHQSGKEPVDMFEVMKNVEQNLRIQIMQTEAHLTISKMPVLYGHETLLTQLFQNLIANSLKYMRPGVPPEIMVMYVKLDGNLLFQVRDNGIGIAEENFAVVFEPFRRLHAMTQYEGSGIGLATCKKIIDLYEGRIWIESKQGEGATFFVELPEKMEYKAPILPVEIESTGQAIDFQIQNKM